MHETAFYPLYTHDVTDDYVRDHVDWPEDSLPDVEE